MKAGILIAVLLLPGGCFLTDVAYKNAPRAERGDAVVYLFRPHAESEAKKDAWFFIDDVPIVKLDRNSHTWIHVPAGKHTLRQQWTQHSDNPDEQTAIAVTWESGQQYYHSLSLANNDNGRTWYISSSRRSAIYSRLINSKYIAATNINKLRR